MLAAVAPATSDDALPVIGFARTEDEARTLAVLWAAMRGYRIDGLDCSRRYRVDTDTRINSVTASRQAREATFGWVVRLSVAPAFRIGCIRDTL